MRLRRLAMVVALLMSWVLFACTVRPAAEISADLGEQFSLAIGETARIAGEDLAIRFDEVAGDSRCPQDVQCIRAGEVTFTLTVRKGTLSEKLVLSEPGLSDELRTVTLREYRLTFHMAPYPEAGKAIPAEEYRLRMKVTR